MSPFKSEAQRKYLFMHEPEVAKKWAHKYGTPKDLPEHIVNKAIDRVKRGKK